jgi:hypothetical protein
MKTNKTNKTKKDNKKIKTKIENVFIKKDNEIENKLNSLLNDFNDELYFELVSYLRSNGVTPISYPYNIQKIKELIDNGKL